MITNAKILKILEDVIWEAKNFGFPISCIPKILINVNGLVLRNLMGRIDHLCV